MQAVKLKRKLTADFVFFAILVGVGILINIILFIQTRSYKSDLDKIKSEIIAQEGKYNKTREGLGAATLLLDVYKDIRKDRHIQTEFVDDITSRIKEAREPLQFLKDKYRLSQLDITITPPTAMKEAFLKRENYIANASKVTLRFSGLTDELVLSFVHELFDEFPGYVSITSLDLEKVGDINEQTVATIKTGVFPILVKGILVFEWIKVGSPKTAETKDTNKAP